MIQPAPHPFNYQPSSSPPILDDVMRKAAFQRTADVLQECDEIRCRLALPPEALGRILDVYISSAREVVAEKALADLAGRTLRVPMTISSHDNSNRPLPIIPGQFAEVTAIPQWLLYRVEEIEINGDPSHWRVHDIKIGYCSQSPHSILSPIPGERFRKGGIMSELRLEVCQIGMHFVLTVEYVGPLAAGEVFEATLVGTAVKFTGPTGI
jgi:hypothetical protein